MKHVMIIYEGAADRSRAEIGDRTPLQVARCPSADRLAAEGRCGMLERIRHDHDWRSEVLLGLLAGLAPAEAAQLYRGPVEAAGLDTGTASYTFVFRGNFVTMDNGQMRDNRVAHMSFDETALLAKAVQDAYDESHVRVIPLAPARVAILLKTVADDVASGNPPELAEGDLELSLPQGRKGDFVRDMLEKSGQALNKLTVNDVRLDLGENPATHLWPWGGGKFFKPAARHGAVLSNSPLAAGFAKLAGLASYPLLDPWSEDESHAVVNADAVAKALGKTDFLMVYVESPREAGAYGSPVEKVRLLERLDLVLLGPALKALESFPDSRVLLTTDNTRALAGDQPLREVPMAVWGAGIAADGVQQFDEVACEAGSLGKVKVENLCGMLTHDRSMI